MTSTTAWPPAASSSPATNSSGARGWFWPLITPAFGPVVAAQLITLRGAFLVGPGPGHDHHVGHVRVGVLDRGPGVFEGGDDPAAVLLDGPGIGHRRMPFL
jgi:hypothetical protein